MNPMPSNAFSDGESNQPTVSGIYGKGLASSLSPMRAQMTKAPFGWVVELSPIRAFDALRLWTHLAAESSDSDDEEPVSLLFDVRFAAGKRVPVAREITSSSSLAEVADQLGIAPIARFDHGQSGQLVLHEQAQRELIGMIDTACMRSVLVAGPIEPRDGKAIAQAVEAGHSPLDVEFRAVAAIEVMRDRVATLHTRSKRHAAMLVAENFRHYLAALRQRPAGEFSVPQDSQIQRLMDVSGSIAVRPIETEVFSTSIDVGISTAVNGKNAPADQSLIYDVPSNTWHDEP